MWVRYIDKNNIWDDGVKKLCKGLAEIKHLAVLSLDTNHVFDQGAFAIAHMIEKQAELKELYLCILVPRL